MDLATLIAALSQPSAYRFAVTQIEVCQTHISAVFLAGEFAFKIKKPVRLSFLDFSTLERRRHFCEEEVRLNRRLAPDVYLGVVPVTIAGTTVAFEGEGPTIEWAVKMRRLPESAALERQVDRGAVAAADVCKLAARLAEFHARGVRGPGIAAFGRFDVVARNIRENLLEAAPMIGVTICRGVHERLLALTEQSLARWRPLIDARAARGVPCDAHGDLHLDHVYLFPREPAPADLVIVDCIEFNERFRSADPVCDMAFLAMDFAWHGRRDLADTFSQAYFEACGDGEGRALLPLYVSYRAAVRAKVDGLQLAESEIPQTARDRAAARARGHWLLALGALETPERRGGLVLVGGLPGTGKSTLAAALAARANFHVVRSDVVRKELAGAPLAATSGLGEGLYSSDWSDRTYAECLRRSQDLLFAGARVIVDATFLERARRMPFYDLALHCGVPIVALDCQTDMATVKERLAARRGDASDADWSVFLHAAQRRESPQPDEQRWTRTVSCESAAAACRQAEEALREAGLADADPGS